MIINSNFGDLIVSLPLKNTKLDAHQLELFWCEKQIQ